MVSKKIDLKTNLMLEIIHNNYLKTVISRRKELSATEYQMVTYTDDVAIMTSYNKILVILIRIDSK